MRRYMFLMHNDAGSPEDANAWGPYLARLRESSRFEGGSSLGNGTASRKFGDAAPCADHLIGYLVLQAPDAYSARTFLVGNPVFEAGGTVEIRELVVD